MQTRHFLGLTAFLLSLVMVGACDSSGGTAVCMTSIGSCDGPMCGIDFGTCSDGVKREIKCDNEGPPFKCECVENSVKQKDVELQDDPYKIGLGGAPKVAKTACGWDVK